MIDILYYIFIFPLESVLGFALDLLHSLTHNYGLSIVILSLLVNLFLLKLAKIAESKATKINALKSVCDKKIAEFKRVFKGAELQSYIRTLYKQKHYHPIFALSALGGLALQVPFFIAVLCLLQDFDGIKGVAFLWIADLSAPDNVFGAHLLPILMTIISLVNVWIVAKERGAKIQGIVIALIFLVLLYQMPSALVLYWTTNMAFSLIRAIVANFKIVDSTKSNKSSLRDLPKANRGNPNLDSAPRVKIAESQTPPSLASATKQSKKTDFFIYRKPFKIAVIALSAILAIGLCLTFALMLYAKNNIQTAPITLEDYGEARIHFGKWDILLRSNSISKVELVAVEWDKRLDSSAIKITHNAKRFVFFETNLDLEKGANLGQISYKMHFTPLLKNLFKYYFSILGAVLGIYLLLCVIARFQAYSESNAQIYRTISIYATLCIAFLICVFTPYQLYGTDITQFDSTQTLSTLSALFGAFLLISFIAIYALSFVPKRFSNIIAFILSVILFSGIAYSFILVGDYGAMDHFVLQKAPEKSAWQILECIAVLLLGIAIMAFTLTRLKRALQIILATLFIVSGVNAVQIVNKRMDSTSSLRGSLSEAKTTKQSTNPQIDCHADFAKSARNDSTNCHTERSEVSQKNKRDSSLQATLSAQNDKASESRNDKVSDKNKPPYADSPLFSYSKNDKNIVVIVLDMFSGSHTPYILEQFPQFKTQLDGFTLYPNAISTTNATAHSITTLIGGEYYAVYNMNKRGQKLAQQIKIGYESIGDTFADRGFSVSYMSDMYSNFISSPKIHLISDYKIFEPYFNEKHNLKSAIDSYRTQTKHYEPLDLISFGLFRFAPEWHLREKIYNNGAWLYKKIPNLLAAIAQASNTYAPTHIVRVNSKKPTFKYFHTFMTHFPYAVYFNDESCDFSSPKSAWEDYPHDEKITNKQYFQHYDSESCALKYIAEYVELLKMRGIYDNTQILIVSDHGGDVSFGTPKYTYRPDVILLFKDFGKRGNLKIDSRLMANYDIPSIFCENLPNGCPNVPPNILKNYPKNREVIYTMPFHWILEKHKENKWLIQKAYKVRGSIYDPKNWTDISDESYGIVNVRE